MTGPREIIELDEDPFADEGEGNEEGSVFPPDTTSAPEIGTEDEDVDFEDEELEDELDDLD